MLKNKVQIQDVSDIWQYWFNKYCVYQQSFQNILAATDLEYASLGSSRYAMMQTRTKMSAVRKKARALSVTSFTTARSTIDATALSVPPIACPEMKTKKLNLEIVQIWLSSYHINLN